MKNYRFHKYIELANKQKIDAAEYVKCLGYMKPLYNIRIKRKKYKLKTLEELTLDDVINLKQTIGNTGVALHNLEKLIYILYGIESIQFIRIVTLYRLISGITVVLNSILELESAASPEEDIIWNKAGGNRLSVFGPLGILYNVLGDNITESRIQDVLALKYGTLVSYLVHKRVTSEVENEYTKLKQKIKI